MFNSYRYVLFYYLVASYSVNVTISIAMMCEEEVMISYSATRKHKQHLHMITSYTHILRCEVHEP